MDKKLKYVDYLCDLPGLELLLSNAYGNGQVKYCRLSIAVYQGWGYY